MSTEKPAAFLDTLPITLAPDELAQGQRAGRRRYVLAVYHRDGVAMVPLLPGAPVIVGRDPLADVAVHDGSLSRRHARFTLTNAEVVVEDLGSTNGTRVGGARVESAALKPGEEVVLGSITASAHLVSSAHALAGADGAPLGVESHEAFRGALEAEIVRARFFGRKLAVIMVRAVHHEDGSLRRSLPRVRELLRPVDHAALYSADVVEILLPEATDDQAATVAAAIVARREGEPLLVCGAAGFPDAATSAEKLIEVSREAARAASAAEPVRFAKAEGPRVWTPGEDEVLGAGAPVAKSAAMRAVIETALRLARSQIPVLLHGETGTGKEVLARFLHSAGARRARPLICVNCGAIPQGLAESTLFGHERGSFSGASQQQKGVFEAAHGGTVLLDEIGELPPAAQAALLRVTETKRVTRVGSTKELEVDARLIAATHRDLEAMCDAGSFRTDLLYRLNAMTLTIPPLRERREDIAPLVGRFLEQANRANERSIEGVHPDAMELLEGYSWPGNVRELRNAVERAVVIAGGEVIQVRDLPERVRASRGSPKSAPVALPEPSLSGESSPSRVLGLTGTFKERMDRVEAEVLVEALRDAGFSQTEAAKRLDMPLRTLQHKIKLHGIKRAGYKVEAGGDG